jgi:CSLREA domain-containing protein
MNINHIFPETKQMGRPLALLFGLTIMICALLMLGLQAAVKPAHAATTFTVNSTEDAPDATPGDGTCETATADECTLRAAIQEANHPNNTGADTINFNIPVGTGCNVTSGVCTINVGSSPAATGQSLPDIIQPVTINGYTQSGATENDILIARDGTNAKLLIELNGADVTAPSLPHNGLGINASNVVVKGLVINRFGGTGIFVFGDGSGAVIGGNFIGTDPSGTQSLMGNGTGVTAFGGGANIIGGREPAAHNLISGNFHGLTIASNTGNTIQGNLIGTDKDGANNLGNAVEGVGIGSSNNIVGSAAADNDLDSNLIAFNGDDGVLITGGTGNRILNNRIHSNGKLGINLAGGREDINGVTKNDGRAKDRDTGSNNLQNFPVISSAITKDTTTTVKGSLRSAPRNTFIIQFFSSPQKDPSGFGEGKEFIGQTEVRTNREGRGSFTFPTGNIRGAIVTATATRVVSDPNNPATPLRMDTSELSKAVTAS